jgi:hypothetical protein
MAEHPTHHHHWARWTGRKTLDLCSLVTLFEVSLLQQISDLQEATV